MTETPADGRLGATATELDVVVPAGLPLLEAAGWVGRACWSEMRIHEVLTDWLAVEVDPALAATMWAVRAHRAELAEAWHRRLPELRELPRADFVVPGGPSEADPADLLAGPDAATRLDPTGSAARARALADALAAMAERYHAHLSVAVGPADGPVADTLRLALARTRGDLALLTAD